MPYAKCAPPVVADLCLALARPGGLPTAVLP